MKLGTTIALCAASAIGTAFALDKFTDGAIKDCITDTLIDRGLIDDDFDDFDDENFDKEVFNPERDIFTISGKEEKPFCAVMPIQDATNIYQMLEDAVGRLSESASDLEAFGDKAISFERLYDALEKSGVIGNSETTEETAESIVDDHSDDPSEMDPDSANHDITEKNIF